MDISSLSSPAFLATSAVLVTAAIVYYHLKVYTFWSSRGIKGPTPVPIFGTNFYYFFKTRAEQDMEWLKKYGRTYGIYQGYLPVLITTDNEILKHIYIKEFGSFVNRNNIDIHGDVMKKWLFWTEDEYWSNQRALVSPMFTANKMRLMMTTMIDCIDAFIVEADRRIKSSISGATEKPDGPKSTSKAAKGAAEGAEFSREDMMTLALDVLAQSFFSVKINAYFDKTNEFFQQAFRIVAFDLPRFLFWSILPRFLARFFKVDFFPNSRFAYFHKLSESIIDERRKGRLRKNDFIQAMLEAKIPENYEKIYTKEDDREAHYNAQMTHDELEKIQEAQSKAAKLFRNFSDLEIKGSMAFFFLAGFETTASSMTFCFFELAHQQAAQQEVYDEIRERLGNKSQIEYSDLLDMKKLDGLVSEVLRLYSPVQENNRMVTKPEGAMIPTKPNPIYLAPRTGISTNLYVLQRDEGYFDRPDEFQLSRFYPENRHKIKPCTYAPFGLGPRGCAGARFALMEIKLCLAKVLLKYQVRPGTKSTYPPKYNQNIIFLQFECTDFKLIPREK